jgi:hypothetical protein
MKKRVVAVLLLAGSTASSALAVDQDFHIYALTGTGTVDILEKPR